jgi:type II secretory pathway pseudopilin PulG
LVVLVIIGMLASMVSFAMFRSMQAAREAKTQALIAKLHNVIARHWDTFETGQPPSVGAPPTQMTVAQWMADEMPCTQTEFSGSTLFTNTLALSVSGTNDDAQCLYQLVLQIADDDLDRINLFSENETKDLITVDSDGDGTPDTGDGTPDYFIDGWGQPIGFIREPKGFREWREDDNDPTSKILIPKPSDINDKDATNSTGGTGLYFPLIYSCGPDKKSGLEMDDQNNLGKPDVDEATYLDNIHNHRMNARLQ